MISPGDPYVGKSDHGDEQHHNRSHQHRPLQLHAGCNVPARAPFPMNLTLEASGCRRASACTSGRSRETAIRRLSPVTSSRSSGPPKRGGSSNSPRSIGALGSIKPQDCSRSSRARNLFLSACTSISWTTDTRGRYFYHQSPTPRIRVSTYLSCGDPPHLMGERGNHGSLGERSMASNHIYARVRHSAQKDLEAALRLLHASARESFGEGPVHAVRRHVKRVRSLLRMVPRTNGRHRLKRVKRCLREVSNALADLRDAQVLLRAVDSFRADEGISRTTRLKLRALMRARLRAAAGEHRRVELRRWLAKGLKKASRLLRGWSPTGGAQAFRQECRRLYERGRAAMELAVQKPADDDALHEWRRRVKDLLHVYELTSSARRSTTRVILSRIRALRGTPCSSEIRP